MLVVGLTGGIASGKSTVSSLLSKRQIPIIDADILARQVVEPGTGGFRALVDHFGADRILNEEGGLDRSALGDIVFHDADQRRWLNGVIHPRVRREMVKGLLRCWLRGEWVVVVDVPLLIEAGFWKWVGEVVVVYVNEKLQLTRLLARPSNPPLTQKQASARISSQLALSSKLPYASTVLDNSGTLSDLESQVDRMVLRWKVQQGGSSGWWWRICWFLPPVGLTAGLICLLQKWWKFRRDGTRRRGRGEMGHGPKQGGAESYEMRDRARRRASSNGESILDG
ncbi:dephospho-CoA kinase-domain-containing protein [Kockovaella imperatae]|uniref:Dephospho-CoA kinase-domain-containing protein n=1 Tax=Kockovaella imperatae TaxID=4999 RepID=A0A1Y1UJB7_9TREE|nr:dephospho-CoA kinase-domain-containing protein [Kockovaella imperatae]ORX38072.1 dephospho-CoA kinase-domain-containing protein [Kockovaella imperatae]